MVALRGDRNALARRQVDRQDAGTRLRSFAGLLEREVVDVIAGDALTRRQPAGRELPDLFTPGLARSLVEIDGTHVIPADDDGPRGKHAGEVQVIVFALHGPDEPAVAQVEAMHVARVVRCENHFAVDDHWGGGSPALLGGRPAGVHRHAADAAADHHRLHLIIERQRRTVPIRIGPDQAVRQQVDAVDDAGVSGAD